MVELSEIYKGITEIGANIYPYDIDFVDAATIELRGQYAIMFDPNKFDALRTLKWALAHENGHCATGCTHRVSSPWDIIERHEYKANRWAYEQYMPPEEIQQAISAGYTEPWELAEWFDLPQSDVENALSYYTNQRDVSFHCAV